MLAHLLRGHEGKFCRFGRFVGKVGKPTHRHDGTIGRHDVDDSSAKVASVGAGDLDLQDDVRAGVDLRSRRPTQRHAGEMRPWLFVRALDTLAHALVRLRQTNSRNAAGLRASARRWFRNGFELGNPSPKRLVSGCRSATFRREVQRGGQRRGLCPGHAGPNHPWIRLRYRGRG